MPRDKHTTIIDGDRYEMTLFGATQGYRLMHLLFRMFGPAFGQVMDALEGHDDIQDVNLSSEAAVAALQALATSVKQSDLDTVIDALKKSCHVGVGGTDKTTPLAGVFELHFSGRMATMFRWLLWGLQTQYQDFSGGLASMMPPGEADGSPAATPEA